MIYRLRIFNLITIVIFILFLGVNTVVAEEIPNSANDVKTLYEGTKIPEVKDLKTVENKSFYLNQAINEKPTVLIFYRGSWCPFCNAQLAKLESIQIKLISMGFQIIAISPDKPENLKEMIKKNQLTYLLLSDKKMKAAKAFHVAFKVDDASLAKYKSFGVDLTKSSGENHHLLPVPSVFLIDKNGIIKYKYSNPDFKIRLEPETLLNEAKKIVQKK